MQSDDKPLAPAPDVGKDVAHVSPMNADESPHERRVPASVVIAQEFGGPLPPPSILREYDDVIPGMGEKLVQGFHDEMAHRRELEKRSVDAEIVDQQASRQERRRGQWFGFTICMTAIVGGTVAAMVAPATAGQVAGGLIGTGGLASLVAVFMTGRPTAKEEAKEKPQSQPNNKSEGMKQK